MSSTADKTPQIVLEWNKLFPATVTDSYTSSFKFMKLLTTVAVSVVCSMKNILPEESYKVEKFAGLRLSILKAQCNDELAQFISTALLQALEAFDKRYLDKLALCFYENECTMENLIECYTFEYTYNPAGATMNLHTKTKTSSSTNTFTTEKARQQTIFMLNRCHETVQNTFQYPPPAYEISIRLYYNDDAPEGYQAPGFSAATELKDHLDLEQEPLNIGKVVTPYHEMVTRVHFNPNHSMQHVQDSWDSVSQKAFPTQNPPVLSSVDTQEVMDFNDAETVKLVDNALVVRCPCNKDDDFELKLITCGYCGYRQHAVCYGILDYLVEALMDHCCLHCYDEDDTRLVTDVHLANLPRHRRESLCIFRRTLELLLHRSEIDGATLVRKFNMKAESAHKLIRKLTSYGVVIPESDAHPNAPVRVNNERLKETIKQHFHVESESDTDLADRLVTETFTQEKNQVDPVKDVLDSMEQVTLQTATELGRMVKNSRVKAKQVADHTLKQYEEALSYNVDNATEDLPLSGEHNPVKVVEKTGKTGVKTARKRTTEVINIGVSNNDEIGLRSRSAAKKKKYTK